MAKKPTTPRPEALKGRALRLSKGAPPPGPEALEGPFYSRYDQWVADGRPYWAGVSLLNELRVQPYLRAQLQKRETAWNHRKLDFTLKQYLSTVPGQRLNGTPPKTKPPGKAVATASPRPEALEGPTTRPEALEGASPEALEGPLSLSKGTLGPEPPKALTPPGIKALPFASLPTLLQEGRIKATEAMRERSRLHAELGGDYTLQHDAAGQVVGRTWQREPLTGTLAAQACQRIVELSDAINAHYDAEQRWATTGALPETPKSVLQELEAFTDAQLMRLQVNSVGPLISRLKKKAAQCEGDALVAVQLQLGLAEQRRDAIKALLARRQQAATTEAERIRAEVTGAADRKRAADRQRMRVKRMARKKK